MAESPRTTQSGKKPGWPTRPRLLGVLFYVVALTVLFGVFSTIATDGQTRAVPYTELKTPLRSDKLASVTINPQRIRGTLKEGDQQIVTIRIEDADLVKELEAHHVTATGESVSDWWSSLLWLLPLAC